MFLVESWVYSTHSSIEAQLAPLSSDTSLPIANDLLLLPVVTHRLLHGDPLTGFALSCFQLSLLAFIHSFNKCL